MRGLRAGPARRAPGPADLRKAKKMSAHEKLDDQARELAALYVMRTLKEEARASYEAHLEACLACRSEVDAMRGIVDQLAFPAAAEPGLDVQDRRIGPVHRPLGVEPRAQRPSFSFVREQEKRWTATEILGVEVRILFMDPEGGRVTKLVRMGPGVSYPTHRHGGPEECYVVSGDLLVGNVALRAGDYQRAEEDTVHAVQSTREGCLLFIVSSMGDEAIKSRNA